MIFKLKNKLPYSFVLTVVIHAALLLFIHIPGQKYNETQKIITLKVRGQGSEKSLEESRVHKTVIGAKKSMSKKGDSSLAIAKNGSLETIGQGDKQGGVHTALNGNSFLNIHYPVLSRQKEEEGEVLLKLLFKSEGEVQEVIVLRSSGYKRLDEEAKRAAMTFPHDGSKEKDVRISFKLQD